MNGILIVKVRGARLGDIVDQVHPESQALGLLRLGLYLGPAGLHLYAGSELMPDEAQHSRGTKGEEQKSFQLGKIQHHGNKGSREALLNHE